MGMGLLFREDGGVLRRGVSRGDRAGAFFDGVLADAFAADVFDDDARCFLPEALETMLLGVTSTALALVV